jgi:hypothetical protein
MLMSGFMDKGICEAYKIGQSYLHTPSADTV